MSSYENFKIFQKKDVMWDSQGDFDLFPELNSMKRQCGITLMGGEEQLLAIGRVLVTKPLIILLDEPSQGLGPQIVELVVELFEKLKSDGFSIIFIEQNLCMAQD